MSGVVCPVHSSLFISQKVLFVLKRGGVVFSLKVSFTPCISWLSICTVEIMWCGSQASLESQHHKNHFLHGLRVVLNQRPGSECFELHRFFCAYLKTIVSFCLKSWWFCLLKTTFQISVEWNRQEWSLCLYVNLQGKVLPLPHWLILHNMFCNFYSECSIFQDQYCTAVIILLGQ